MNYKNKIIGVSLLLSLAACTDNDAFVVRVSDGCPGDVMASSTLYLDCFGVEGVSTIDSAKVNSMGTLSLKGKKQDSPAFYRLRAENRSYTFVVEPNQSMLNLRIDDSTNYRVVNSEVNIKLKDYLSFENAINDSIKAEVARFGSDAHSRDLLDARVLSFVESYKDSVRHMVYANTSSPVAYYALFRKLAYGITPFNPMDKKDLRLYSAVATAWHSNYKDTPREKQLYKFVTKARSEMKQDEYEQFFSNATTANFPDLSFADDKGKIRSLYDLRGKFILLDFCVYSQMSQSDYLLFKNVYDKYKSKGLEIYQVSYDTDYEYWKKTVADFPWICVSDINGISIRTYNITSLPYNYLIDKSGNIVAKNVSLLMLEKWLR